MDALIGAAVALVVVLIRFLVRYLLRKPRASAKAHEKKPPAPAAPAPAVRTPVLRGVAGVYEGAVVELDQESCTIGRDARVANLVFPPDCAHVSTRHCKVRFRDGAFEIEDLHSTNGTTLTSGTRVEPGRPHRLQAGERFSLAGGSDIFEVTYV